MSLMERVSALIRANLNDLVEKAEDPEKMLKQVILDMENQLIQVKTQVAVAIADEHLLDKKLKENAANRAEWMRKAELAVDKRDDALARAALERCESHRFTGEALDEQLTEQRTQTETLRTSLRKLDQKLREAREKCELLIAQNRRARMMAKVADAKGGGDSSGAFDKVRRKVQEEEMVASTRIEVASVDERFEDIERNERIEQLLTELKARRQISA
ncbi:MAG TPA: PspA/IM30 family protein [Thermoanaerobaculia bacterium]